MKKPSELFDVPSPAVREALHPEVKHCYDCKQLTCPACTGCHNEKCVDEVARLGDCKNDIKAYDKKLEEMVKEKTCRFGHECNNRCQDDKDCPCVTVHCCAFSDCEGCDDHDPSKGVENKGEGKCCDNGLLDEEDTKGGTCSKCGAWKGGDYGVNGNGERSRHKCVPTTQSWQERFDEKFVQMSPSKAQDFYNRPVLYDTNTEKVEEIKPFISRTLQEAVAKARQEEAIKCYDHAKEAVEQERRRIGEVESKYNELIMAVSMKHEGETRHETALRYIIQAERIEGETSSSTLINQTK